MHADLIEVYKMLNGSSDVFLESMFTLDSNKRTRGHLYKLIKNRFNTDKFNNNVNTANTFFSEKV